MRTTLSTAALLAAVVLVTASAQPAMAATAGATWTPALASGSRAGVKVVGGVARIDPRTAFLAPPDPAATSTAATSTAATSTAATSTAAPTAAKPAGPERIDEAEPDGTGADSSPRATQAAPAARAADRVSGTAGATHTAITGARGARRGAATDGTARTTLPKAVLTGLLTLPTHRLPAATDRIATTVVARLTAGATATVDVRGLRSTGNWSEWSPADAAGTAVLPEPSTQVQARLVLTGNPGPAVTAVTLAARAPSRTEGTASLGAPLTYRVFATREGLPGGTTANGHVIAPHDHFVALPSRRALSPNGTSDYSVRVCAPNGRCAFAPVWDVGPWNTHDDYWNPATTREQWTDLPQGTPEAQAAYRNGYNGGNDGYGRHVVNPAGIDLGDGVFWDDLGLVTNTTVTVEYLWTGDVRLAKVVDTGPVFAAPAPDADVVGVAAGAAGVPVECAVGDWLRIGVGQYLPAAAVSDLGAVGRC